MKHVVQHLWPAPLTSIPCYDISIITLPMNISKATRSCRSCIHCGQVDVRQTQLSPGLLQNTKIPEYPPRCLQTLGLMWKADPDFPRKQTLYSLWTSWKQTDLPFAKIFPLCPEYFLTRQTHLSPGFSHRPKYGQPAEPVSRDTQSNILV